MVSQTAEYALRAVICLAHSPEKAMTTHQIAESACVSSGYLSKVLHLLCRAGVVYSRRGLHGGYTFARPLDQINLLDIVNAVSPFRRLKDGALVPGRTAAGSCAAIEHLNAAVDWVEHHLAGTTLQDLLVCHLPATPTSIAVEPARSAGRAVNLDSCAHNAADVRPIVTERIGS